jgi:hypothetical protein
MPRVSPLSRIPAGERNSSAGGKACAGNRRRLSKGRPPGSFGPIIPALQARFGGLFSFFARDEIPGGALSGRGGFHSSHRNTVPIGGRVPLAAPGSGVKIWANGRKTVFPEAVDLVFRPMNGKIPKSMVRGRNAITGKLKKKGSTG